MEKYIAWESWIPSKKKVLPRILQFCLQVRLETHGIHTLVPLLWVHDMKCIHSELQATNGYPAKKKIKWLYITNPFHPCQFSFYLFTWIFITLRMIVALALRLLLFTIAWHTVSVLHVTNRSVFYSIDIQHVINLQSEETTLWNSLTTKEADALKRFSQLWCIRKTADVFFSWNGSTEQISADLQLKLNFGNFFLPFQDREKYPNDYVCVYWNQCN